MRIIFDRDANAAYIALTQQHARAVKHSIVVEDSMIAGKFVLDFDPAGHLIGIDILNATRLLPPEVLTRAERQHERDALAERMATGHDVGPSPVGAGRDARRDDLAAIEA